MSEQKSLAKKAERSMSVAAPTMTQERQLMTLGASHNWPFRVLGVAPVPIEPVYIPGWWLVPVASDNTQIPARALNRVRAIYEAGIRPKAFIIAHEAPSQLLAPANAPRVSKIEVWSRQIAQQSASAIWVGGKLLTTVVIPFAQVALGVAMLVSLGLASAIMVDPCLIAITENGVWIQIDFWTA